MRQEGVTPDPAKSVLELELDSGVEPSPLQRHGGIHRIDARAQTTDRREAVDDTPRISGAINTQGFGSERYDIVVDFDVLHRASVTDPADVVSQLYVALRPGGYLLLTEPAHHGLNPSDASGIRGWTRSDLLRLLWSAGFAVRRVSGMLLTAMPVAALAGIRDTRRPPAPTHGLTPGSYFSERILRGILWGERQALQRVSLPMGGCWAVLAQRLHTSPTSCR